MAAHSSGNREMYTNTFSGDQLNVLRQKLDVVKVLADLVKTGLITPSEEDIIRRYRHDSVKIEKVLDVVQKGGPSAYRAFLDVIYVADKPLYQLLINANVQETRPGCCNAQSFVCTMKVSPNLVECLFD